MISSDSISLKRAVNAATTAVVLLSAAWFFTTPLRNLGSAMAYAQDDFYYYLIAARNLAMGRGSTFDGSTLTNGYHPLYFVVLWCVYHFTSRIAGVFQFLSFLDTLSAVTIFLASRAIVVRRVKDVWPANGLALAAVCVCYPNLQHQMEVTLTLPLLLIFLYMLDRPPEEMSSRWWAGAGVVGSLMVLSRLDSMLLVILLGMCAVAESEYRRAVFPGKLLAFLAGFLPLIAGYLVTNEVYFHRLMPISGAAKQLKTTHGFHWIGLLQYRSTFVGLILFAILLLALLVFRKRLAKEDRVVYGAALAFPIAHWLMQVRLSDWSIWPWYTYSLRPAILVALLLTGVLLARIAPPRVQRFAGIFVFTIFLLVVVTRRFRPNGIMNDIYLASEQISEFAKTHPGRYAMGDRAGMMAFLNGQPTIQTEGLMMDNAYLGRIRRQEPLRDVLKEYNIDYYVAFSEHLTPGWKPVDRCYEAREPAQGGPGSPQLRGEFCDPVWRLLQNSGETMIFDLRGEQDTPAGDASTVPQVSTPDK